MAQPGDRYSAYAVIVVPLLLGQSFRLCYDPYVATLARDNVYMQSRLLRVRQLSVSEGRGTLLWNQWRQSTAGITLQVRDGRYVTQRDTAVIAAYRRKRWAE